MWQIRSSSVAVTLTGAGAVVLTVSLFLAWSHQLPAAELTRFRGSATYGIPADPTAWQVYAIAGEVLAALALGAAAAGLWGSRPTRGVALIAVALGLAFVIHAAAHAPTNGLLLSSGSGARARYVLDPATPGMGETVALVGLVLSAVGLALAVLAPTRAS